TTEHVEELVRPGVPVGCLGAAGGHPFLAHLHVLQFQQSPAQADPAPVIAVAVVGPDGAQQCRHGVPSSAGTPCRASPWTCRPLSKRMISHMCVRLPPACAT